ncbi:hypothetical protein C7A09_23610 [Pseudomonas fluorescens]|nr:hypothetical protein C7A09_23610 [Pseudomonas fluorescens]
MAREHPSFIEHAFETAAELWAALSPTHRFTNEIEDLIYRGQADARWPLIPTVLRPGCHSDAISYDAMVDTREVIFFEYCVLSWFVKHCDAVGIPVPNDSQSFRKKFLSLEAMDHYQNNPTQWPDPQVLDLMAMAQHHGVPTRLLDWTTRGYTAAYFAASSAVSRFKDWTSEDRLAIWVINRVSLGTGSEIVLHHSPGSISRHLAAQGGLFTVHPLCGKGGSKASIVSLEGLLKDIEYSPFIKLTLPVSESPNLLTICSKAGINGATIYQSADGAGRAVLDDINRAKEFKKRSQV